MADNVSIDPGPTPTVPVATDDIGGVAYQRFKPAVGVDGVAVDVSTTNPMPVGDAGGSLTVDAPSWPLPTGASTETTLAAQTTLMGGLTETAPASDTASSGANGRLQRVAQRLSSLIALLPASLGQKTSAASLAVTVASDQSTLNVTQPDTHPASGTITVQDTVSVSTSTGQNSATLITGTPTAGSFHQQAVPAIDVVRIQITGTWTGTLQFEKSIDNGTTWTLGGAQVMSTTFIAGSVTGNGIFATDADGVTHVRVRAIAAMTGTATIQMHEGVGAGYVKVLNALRLVDNSSGAQNTIKAASTAALATDTAIVVAVRDAVPITAAALPLPSGAATETSVALSATALGAPADAAATTTGSVIAQLRRVANLLAGTLTVASHAVTNAGTFAVQATEARAATGAAPTAFTSTTSAVVFSSNASRKLFTVYNNSDKDLFLMMAAAAASATSYHVKVPASGGYFATNDYSGEIRGIMSAAITTGQVNPGEFT